ncbi:MAG: hypothetical protein KGQ37_04705 [Hyphomicrobiales bacterium]|nr:hypothetical protein [Hyphomicrobiales bacterium]
MQAISLPEAAARIGALRQLANMLDEEARPLSTPAPEGEQAERGAEWQMFAASYGRVADLAVQRPVDELDIINYVAKGETDCAIQALARLARLPYTTAFRLFSSQRADFLVVVCRAQCFAWSTTESLLAQFRGAPLSREVMSALCDDYHDMEVATAQRFVRFLSAHFPARSARLS